MNTYLKTEAPAEEEIRFPKRSRFKLSKSVQKLLNGEFLTRDGMLNHLPFILFLAGLFILHISLMYYFENTQREMVNSKHQLNEMKSQFNTTMSVLELQKQQSTVAKTIEQMGLEELRNPPAFIDVEKGFLNSED
jgi:cell division protein FtsL